MPLLGAFSRFCIFTAVVFSAFSQATDSVFEEVIPDLNARYQYVDSNPGPNSQLELLMVWNGEIDDQTLSQSKSRATPVIVNTSTEAHRLLHVDGSGNLKADIITNVAFSQDNTKIVYVSDNAASGQVEGINTNWLHVYDIATGQTGEIALPAEFDDAVSKLSVFSVPGSLYVIYKHNLAHYSFEDNSIHYLPLSDFECENSDSQRNLLFVTKDIRKRAILREPCGPQVIAVGDDGTVDNLFERNSYSDDYRADLNGEYIDYNFFYSDRRREAIYHRWSFLTDTNEIIRTSLPPPEERSFFDASRFVIQSSIDERYRIYKASYLGIPGILNETVFDQWDFLIVDAELQKIAVIELPSDRIDSDDISRNYIPANVSFGEFSSESRAIFLNVTFPDEEATVLRFEIALGELFSGPFPKIGHFEPQSTDPLKVEFGDLSYDGQVVQVKRTHMSTGESSSFYVTEFPFIDYKWGLQSGEVKYELFACKNNYVCDNQGEPTIQILNVTDFAAVPEFELLDFDRERNGYRLRLTNDKPQDTIQNIYRYDVLGAEDSYQTAMANIPLEETEIFIYQKGSVKGQRLFVQHCINNVLERNLVTPEVSCSENYSAVKTVDFFPNAGFAMAIAVDNSAVQLHWEALTDASYTLTRTNIENQSSQVLMNSGSQLSFVDTELLDTAVQYILEVCNGTCLTYTIDRDPVSQIATHTYFRASGEVSGFIVFESNRFWDSYQLFRKVAESSSESLLLHEWQQHEKRRGVDISYVDNSIMEGTEYVYQMMGCSAGECVEIAATDLKFSEHLEGAPAPVENIRGEASFLSYHVTWDVSDTDNLHGFELFYRAKNNSGLFSLAHKDVLSKESTFPLTEQTAGGVLIVRGFRSHFSKHFDYRQYSSARYFNIPDINAFELDMTNDTPLLSPKFTPGNIAFTINAPAVADQFRLFMKTQDEEQFSQIAFFKKPLKELTSTATFHHQIEYDHEGKALQFYVESCSVWAGKCSENNEIVGRDNGTTAVLPTTPQLTRSNFDEMNRTTNIQFTRDINTYYSEVVVSRSNSDPLSDVFQQSIIEHDQAQELLLSGFNSETDYYAFVRNCGNVGCSEFAVPLTLRFNAQTANTSEMTFDAQNPNVSIISGSYQFEDRAGSLAFGGQLKSTHYMDLVEGISFDMELFFADQNTDLMSLQFIYDWHDMSTQETGERLSQILKINKTSNGNFQLESRLWQSAIPFAEELSNTWVNLRFDVAANGIMSVFIDDELISSSDHPIEMAFFEWVKFFVDVDDTTLARMAINSVSQRETTFLPFDFVGSSVADDVITSQYRHPEFVAYDTLSDAVTRIQVWQKDAITQHYSQILDSDKASVLEYLQAEYMQFPINSFGNLLRLCSDAFCLPGGWHAEIKPEYSSVDRWDSPQIDNNTVTFNLFGLDGDYAQQFNLYRYEISATEPEFLLMAQFTSLITGAATDGSYSLEVSEADESHYYSLQICNPIGCLNGVNSETILLPLPGDADGDGVIDEEDAFPNDPFESSDIDGDGLGDNVDTDADNDGLANDVEIRIGTDPLYANDGLRDNDGDGYADLYENLSGSNIDDFESVPSDNGYFESFESPISESLSFFVTGFINMPVQFIDDTRYPIDESRVNDAIHSSTGFKFKPDNHHLVGMGSAVAKGADVYYRGFVKSGIIWFAVKDHQGMPLVKVDNRQIAIEENNIIPVGNDFVIYAFEVSNNDQRTKEVIIHIPGDNFILDGVFFPGGKTCDIGAISVRYDYNCDGKAELAGTFLNDGLEHLNKTIATNEVSRLQMASKSSDTLIPISGDFDGDGIDDPGFRVGSSRSWYYRKSSNDELVLLYSGMQEQDIPAIGDYDGDGKSDIAFRRPSDTTWYVRKSSDNGVLRIKFGLQSTDIPVQGDYDGDGITDPAVVRLSNSTWYIKYSLDGSIGRESVAFNDGDIPIAADVDGDGKTDLVIRRPASQSWWIKRSSDNQVNIEYFGKRATDIPVVADYDGDGKDDLAVRRTSDFHFYVKRSSDGGIGRYVFGKSREFIPHAAPISLRTQFASRDWSFIEE